MRLIKWASLLTVFAIASVTVAQEFDERFNDWPVDLKIPGRVIIGKNLEHIDTLKRLLPESSAEDSAILVCAKADATSLVALYEEAFSQLSVVEELADLNPADLAAEVKTIIWHSDTSAKDLESTLASNNMAIANTLAEIAKSDRTLCVIGQHARLAGRVAIANLNKHPSITTGSNILPDCVVQLETDDKIGGIDSRLLSVLASQRNYVGVNLQPNALLLLDGRKVRVAGGNATFSLMASETQPLRIQTLIPQASRRQSPNEWLLDLTEWRRDAIDRTLEPFPAAQPREPHVTNGKLFIVGGGGTPEGLMEQFVTAAGGRDAKLVYVPCSELDELPENQRTVQAWQQMGVEQASFIHTKDRIKANSDNEFLAPLRNATGIWFGGGRQWNFADSYYGTKAHKLMKYVLTRGGAIGGSSAGASIQARYLARATPIENFRIMAPGYERGGLGFISGVAIDQHFTQRGRQKDMTQLVNRYPQLLGIGIDERTAIIVQNSVAEVVGQGRVHFYDRNLPVYPDRDDFIALEAGQSYDLANRQIIENSPTAESAP